MLEHFNKTVFRWVNSLLHDYYFLKEKYQISLKLLKVEKVKNLQNIKLRYLTKYHRCKRLHKM